MNKKVFGKSPSGERLNRIAKSPNYRDGQFQNIEPTSLNPNNVSIFRFLSEFLKKPRNVTPATEVPNVKTDLVRLEADKPTIVWFGHSSYLISSKGFNILVDPVLSGYASPVKLFGKTFMGSDNYNPEDFPPIDILIITHDHYDHLDFRTVVRIDAKVKRVIVPLGVGEHLEYWGINKNKIAEIDWWEAVSINSGVEITATPARHFSGRGFVRAKTLWSSYALKIHGYKIFLGGDSGYDNQFKIIGDKFQGFDLALLECGQYGHNWPHIHMHPEDTIRAAKDLNAKIIFPVHWAKFVLANHAWNEPIKRLVISAQIEKQQYVAPLIGQPYTIGAEHQQIIWWDFD
jgi:L-ascorbate metabolism protein UlaG (beta-lactamase superfamily)